MNIAFSCHKINIKKGLTEHPPIPFSGLLSVLYYCNGITAGTEPSAGPQRSEF